MKKVRHSACEEAPRPDFTVAVTGLFRWADGPDHGELAFVRLSITTATACYNETIPATSDSKLSFLRRHPDLWVSHKGRAALECQIAELIADQMKNPITGWAFSRTGLHHLEEQIVFVAGDRLIGGEGLSFVTVPDLSRFHLQKSALPSKKIAEVLLNVLKRNGVEVVAPVFAFGLLTALQSLILESGIPLTSVLYLSGRSGFGKTETVKKFFALYDLVGTKQPALITEAGSTMAGFRKNLRSARDLPVVLDDLCISSARDSQRKRLEVGAQAVREASNKGAIRTRAGEHEQELSTEAGVAVTAEFDLGTISDVTRCIIVPLDAPMEGGRPDDRGIAAGALDAFLSWFVPRYQQECELLRQRYADAAAAKRLDRLETGIFCLHWAFDCFLRFALDVGALNEGVYRESNQIFGRILHRMETRQRQLLAFIDARTPKATVPELLWHGIQDKAIPLVKKRKRLDASHGLLRGNDVFLPPALLEAFISMQDGYQGVTRNKISRELKSAGVLVLHENDRSNTVKLKNGLPRVLHIRLDILKERVAPQADFDYEGRFP